MANKKRRKRPRPSPSAGAKPDSARATGGANVERRERKDEARRARERARRQAARRARTRRGVSLLIAGGIGLGVVWFINRAAPPDQLSEQAQAAVTAAGCSGPEEVLPSDPPGGQHLAPGESPNYTQTPATSGVHAPGSLPTDPNVFTEPVDEGQAVHFMEHAGIVLYYRQDSIPQEVVDRLATVANQERNTLLAPYPDLPDGRDLAFATWNRLLTCPEGVSAEQAGRIARGFVEAYACTSVGPEPSASPEC
jgi:hypothetical protein